MTHLAEFWERKILRRRPVDPELADALAVAAFHKAVRELVEDEAARIGMTLDRLKVWHDPQAGGQLVTSVRWRPRS